MWQFSSVSELSSALSPTAAVYGLIRDKLMNMAEYLGHKYIYQDLVETTKQK